MDDQDSEWTCKGATLSDKSAREEFGLTQEEIHAAAQAGTLQYRVASMHGNPWLRLLRREVEALVIKKYGNSHLKDRQAKKELALVIKKYGNSHLKDRQAKTELARVNRELKRLKIQIAQLEERKSKLIAGIGK